MPLLFVKGLLLQVIAALCGLYLADLLISEVYFTDGVISLALAGVLLGLANFALKPLLNIITLPLRILTLGLFGLIINAIIVWAIDILFAPLVIVGLIPLLLTTLLVWLAATLFSLFK